MGDKEVLVYWEPPTAWDNVRVVSFNGTSEPNSSFPIGNTTVTYTAVDEALQEDTCIFVVSVSAKEETAKPATPTPR